MWVSHLMFLTVRKSFTSRHTIKSRNQMSQGHKCFKVLVFHRRKTRRRGRKRRREGKTVKPQKSQTSKHIKTTEHVKLNAQRHDVFVAAASCTHFHFVFFFFFTLFLNILTEVIEESSNIQDSDTNPRVLMTVKWVTCYLPPQWIKLNQN